MIGNARIQPVHLLDHLEAGIGIVETEPDEDREQEGEDGRQERDVADVAPRGIPLVPDQQDQERANQRQEGDRGKNGPVGHQKELPSIIHVTSAAMPIIMAKA